MARKKNVTVIRLGAMGTSYDDIKLGFEAARHGVLVRPKHEKNYRSDVLYGLSAYHMTAHMQHRREWKNRHASH